MNIVRIYELFPTESDCIAHLEKVRWKVKPICPYCGSDRTTAAPTEQRHHCNNCKTSFSVTVGTIFHHTHLPLQKWLLAVSVGFGLANSPTLGCGGGATAFGGAGGSLG